MSEKETLHEMSEEQDIVYQHILEGKNVVVDACAGSGKSTTILSIAQKLPNKQFLQTTYNSMLRKEVKQKIDHLTLENINVQTFHSLCVKYYLLSAYSDTGIRYVVYNDLPPRLKIPPIEILVCDEAQDMTFLYFQFMIKYMKDSGSHNIQILIMGDFMQGLYEFKGADTRFLTHADKIWSNHSYLKTPIFEKCTLKMSYRITNPMADFVNDVMLGERRLLACREGEPVHYIRNTRWNIERYVTYEIMRLIKEGYSPGDFFVLGGSVKKKNMNIRKMENVLVEKDIPCHVPTMENDNIDEKVIEGKVVFSTYHGIKGRQRKFVFMTEFDNNYMECYGRDLEKDRCPNTLYVGATRATHGLYLLEMEKNTGVGRPLGFLKLNHHQMKEAPYIEFKGQARSIFHKKTNSEKTQVGPKKHDITPTGLLSFMKESVIEEISPILDRIFQKLSVETESDLIDIPVLLKTKRGYYEDISDLNGIAIPSFYYDYLIQKNTENRGMKKGNILYQIIQTSLLETRSDDYSYLKKIIAEELPEECTSISDYLFLANIQVASQERLYFKLKQIERHEYEWLTDEIMEKCIQRFDTIIGEKWEQEPQIEKKIIDHSMETENEVLNTILSPHFLSENGEQTVSDIFRFSAITDLITDDTVWELKCTTNITIEHLLQLVIYSWIWRNIYPEKEKYFKIVNIKSGEILKLEAKMDELNHIMVLLLKGKYGKIEKKNDEEFIQDCVEIYRS